MPAYTIQQDRPWVETRAPGNAVASSIFSDDYEEAIGDVMANLKATAEAGADALRTIPSPDSSHPSYHAHPQQQISDSGPQVRASRLPIFKQVRSMLQKPANLTTPSDPRWDEYTGELSATGKPSNVKPSAYASQYQGAFQARRLSPPPSAKARRSPAVERSAAAAAADRPSSPVSMIQEDVSKPVLPLTMPEETPRPWSPVSPISTFAGSHEEIPEENRDLIPSPLSTNLRRSQQKTPSDVAKQIKRKPAPRSVSTIENQPPSSPLGAPASPSQSSDVDESRFDDERVEPPGKSHFSWTTYAGSVAPGRPSIDTMPSTRSPPSRYPSVFPEAREDPNSRFSWSTVNTHMTAHARPDTPPSQPPPIPTKFPSPPVQSILSRQRPIKRMDRGEWSPPPREHSVKGPGSGSGSATPNSITTMKPLSVFKTQHHTPNKPSLSHNGNSSKALPLPPSMSSANNLTHLESLQAQQRNLALQSRNVEKMIVELEKVERASPIDVPFATVRDSRKKLEEHRTRLAEVKLEEREIGVAISRARRKEGEEEGLWVRRVTG